MRTTLPVFHRSPFSTLRVARLLAVVAVLFSLSPVPRLGAQTAFVNFNTPGEFTGNFTPWNDTGLGFDAGNYSFAESANDGVGGSGGISVFQSLDTTATLKSGWNFSTNGATIILSALVHADGQASGDKVQLGILNTNVGSLNNNTNIAFESYRTVPTSATDWSLREQYRTGGTLTETILGDLTVQSGHWYKFVVAVTNTAGATGSYNTGCAIYDYGIDGLTPGANLATFPTAETHAGQTDVTIPAVWPALRAFEDGGIDAWDNFLVYTTNSPPVITLALTNMTVLVSGTAAFTTLADGPGTITFSWYTNGVRVTGASGVNYTTPALTAAYTNVFVVASNNNGSATNTATLSVVVPTAATITNLPASGIFTTTATLNGQVLSTGGNTPSVTVYYGPVDGGANAAAWANNVALGQQSGVFAQQLTGLSSNSVYYFTAKAVNTAGTTWAAPSQTFTTPATNPPVSHAVAVLTQHNDNARTGMNLNETILNASNVNAGTFGLLYTRPVDDQIYAQPLIATGVNLPGKGTRNLVIVATVNDSIYAYDADDSTVTAPYWTNSFINPPNIIPPANSDLSAVGACGGGCLDFSGKLGIVSTPVIDPMAGTVYLVARTRESGTNFVQRLHALDITTGHERPNSPVIITATYPGTGDSSVNGLVQFDPLRQNQRPALTLVNGLVYICWTSHCDLTPYHGWVIGYDATTLQQTVVYNDDPDGSEAGIWMSGQGPCADTNGNLYLSTGNGTVGNNGNANDTTNRGQSFLKLTRSGSRMTVASWFTPNNWSDLNNGDLDLGSAGLLLIPGTSLAISGGKGGVEYLVNRDNMGGLSPITADTNIIQSFQVTSDEIHGGMVWWDGPGASYGYVWPSSVYLQQYTFNRAAGLFNLPALAQSPTAAPGGQPGGMLALSANGATAGSGILWAAHQLNGDANQQVLPGILHAYNAQNVSIELWNSQQNSARDAVGNFAKFVPPTVANGKVYLATFSGQLNVYGTTTAWVATPTFTPSGGAFNYSVLVTISDATPSAAIYYTLDGSQPITSSTPYTGPFLLTSNATVRAGAFAAGYNNNVTASAAFVVDPLRFTTVSASNGAFQLFFSGTSGKTYVLYGSTNLTSWVPLATNLAPANIFQFTDPNAASFPYRFYRTAELP